MILLRPFLGFLHLPRFLGDFTSTSRRFGRWFPLWMWCFIMLGIWRIVLVTRWLKARGGENVGLDGHCYVTVFLLFGVLLLGIALVCL